MGNVTQLVIQLQELKLNSFITFMRVDIQVIK